MVCMFRTCLFLIDDALRFEYVRNILAVMPPLCLPSRCRNVSVGRLLVWPDFALLESLLVSTRPAPCSPLTPSDRSRSSAPEPEISCRASSGRAREAVRGEHNYLQSTLARPNGISWGHSGVATALRAFFLPEITFLLAHLGFPLFAVTTLSRPGKGLHDGKKIVQIFTFLPIFSPGPQVKTILHILGTTIESGTSFSAKFGSKSEKCIGPLIFIGGPLFFNILNWTKLPLGGIIIADHADYSAEIFINMDERANPFASTFINLVISVAWSVIAKNVLSIFQPST